MRRPCLLLLGVLVAAPLLAATPVVAQLPATLHWEYEVSVEDPASGDVHVELTIRGFDSLRDERYENPYLVRSFTFHTDGGRTQAKNVTPGPSTPFATSGSSFVVEVDEDVESFSYDVKVLEPAYRVGQHLNYVGPEFALFKAEALPLNFDYGYVAGTRFTNETTIRLDAPRGWEAAAPWEDLGGGVHRLGGDEVHPRGYIVMGRFLQDETRELSGKSFRYVRLGEPGAYENDLWRYLERATPYYEAVYGPGTGSRILVVNAPAPMFHGGLAGVDSFFVHEDVDLRTLAHEYAHVHQHFATVEVPPSSALWLHEGDAEYHSALSLVAAELWGPEDVNAQLREAAAYQDKPELQGRALPEAHYGGMLERFAYAKGLVVLKALDDLLRERTLSNASLSDLVRHLNSEHDLGAQGRPSRVDNHDVQQAVERIVGGDASAFFDAYVYGTQWPKPSAFESEGSLVVSELSLQPARASPGEKVTVSATISNSGTTPVQRTLLLVLNGEPAPVPEQRIDLAVGRSAHVTFEVVAPEAGDHELRLLYQRAILRSLAPASFAIERVALSADTVRAQTPFTLLVFVQNVGERDGHAQVDVLANGEVVGQADVRLVEAGGTTAFGIPLQLATPGLRDLEVQVLAQGSAALRHPIQVDVVEKGDGFPHPTGEGSAPSGVAQRLPVAATSPLAFVCAVAMVAWGFSGRAS